MTNSIERLITRIQNFNNDYNHTSSGSQWSKWESESKSIRSYLNHCTDSELLQIKDQMSEYALSKRGEFASYFKDLIKPTPKASLSKVMKTAWTIFKAGLAETFSIALCKAWKLVKISLGIGVKIAYAKASTGELREATALQLGSLSTIEKGFVRYLENINGSTQWRSFKITHLAA